MKRIDEKVKDIVDVRSHASLTDFASDPLLTLTSYHFTDLTADMMAKWMNAASRVVDGGGVGMALAGFRGVGKSHFLAVFGAMLAHPEYRSRVTDQLVSLASQNLARKSYAVATLRRGTRPTLFGELKDAIAPVIGSDPESLSDSLSEILVRASESTGDLPLILLIDTAFERSSRVSRDDGPVLSEIAEIAKTLGIFVGIALDDDVSGADGVNSAISRTLQIDYLDQEHLYRIVDQHIFPKNGRMQAVLHDIYDYYRMTVPGFRWSEERFRSLYPLHPSIMEIAPFVRLYVHDFALLSFASEAGSRILGRPANSLIAPDEVFDKAETRLRSVEALQAAFAAFDKINEVVVAKTPVMKRLQAKLILKGLFLFSMNDEGATATEIGASMLIFDEYDPIAAVQHVESLLSSFADALPDSIRIQKDSNGNRRFAFKLDGKDDLKSALQTAAEKVPDEVTTKILQKQMEERFADCVFGGGGEGSDADSSDCVLIWRGGLRKGRVVWNGGQTGAPQTGLGPNLDWIVNVGVGNRSAALDSSDTSLPIGSWRPAPLRPDEVNALKRYHLLLTDSAVRTEFQDHLPASLQSHANAAEMIFQRTYLDDATLEIEGFEYNFTGEARSAQTQSQVFSIMLESLFEGRFPLHPYFPQIIRMKDVSNLVADLFGGARPNLDEVQNAAHAFAVPLGIVTKPGPVYVAADGDVLKELPLVARIFAQAKQDRLGVYSLESIFNALSIPPYGLVKEACYLLLAALVSCRLIEFVTSNGDRINHRSLDLKLIWDDIIGVATPSSAGYTNERLVMWAALLTEKGSFETLGTAKDRAAVVEALGLWQIQWKERRIADRFDKVSDDLLNTHVWRLARTSIKAFRMVSDAITAVLDNTLAVEDGLQRIADAFSDSEVEFARYNGELAKVEDFIVGAKLCEKIAGWMSLCEHTGNPEIDGLRINVDAAISTRIRDPRAMSNVDLDNIWETFKKAYSTYFLDRHDALLATPVLREKLNDLMKTDLWWEFENLSGITGFDPGYRLAAARIVQRIKQFDCRHNTRDILKISPSCGCTFTLGEAANIENLPQELWKNVNEGLGSFREMLRTRRSELNDQLQRLMGTETDEEMRRKIAGLSQYVTSKQDFPRMADVEFDIVRRAFAGLAETDRLG